MKTISVDFNPDLTEEEFNTVMEKMITSQPDENHSITDDGIILISVPDDDALAEEAFCLGMSYAVIEAAGIENSFFITVEQSGDEVVH